MHNKRAAVSLGVNAIVILIIAVIVLGIILGFLRGMFRKVETTLEEGAMKEPEPPTPTASDPITLSNDIKVIDSGETGYLKVSVYNNNESGVNANLSVKNCDPDWILKIDTEGVTYIQPHAVHRFIVSIKTSKVSVPDSVLCTVEVVGKDNAGSEAWKLTAGFVVKVNP